MKHFFALTIAGFIVAASFGSARGQDTVGYRLRTTTLNDSTVFRYEIGSIKLIQSGGYHFLDFQNPTGLNPDDYFTTDSFAISSATDSISFARFASFDDRNYIPSVNIDTSDHSQMDSIYTLFHTRYSSINITPDTGSFGSTSSIMYVVELRNAMDNTVLATLDTLKCYVNGSGQLRYRNYPSSFNLRKICIGPATGMEAYIYVHILYNLPLSSSILGYKFQSSGYNTPAIGLHVYQNQEGLPSVRTYGISPAKAFVAIPQNSAIMSDISPDPASSHINFEMKGFDNHSQIWFQIINTEGAVIKTVSTLPSSNSMSLDISDIPSGSYNLKASSAGTVAIKKFQIIHN